MAAQIKDDPMKARTILLITVFAATCSVGPTTSFSAGSPYSGNQLINGCLAFMKSDFPANIEPAVFADAWICRGLISGVIAVMLLHRDFCPAADVTVAQGMRVINKYLADHPESLDQSMPMLAFTALRS